MRRNFPEDHEEPWSEEEWLEDMKRSDARADRFGELLETLQDHPNRDELVAREMGWADFTEEVNRLEDESLLDGEPGWASIDGPLGDDDDDAEEDEDLSEFPELVDEDDAGGFEESSDDDEDDEDEPEDVRHPLHAADAAVEPEDEVERKHFRDDPSRRIWEFHRAHDVSMRVRALLGPYGGGEDDPTDGQLTLAIAGPMIASAKIVGGHSLGYDKHYINGNIARQRVGLDAMDKSIEACKQLALDKHIPADLLAAVLPELNALRDDLAARIERMRARARRLHGA